MYMRYVRRSIMESSPDPRLLNIPFYSCRLSVLAFSGSEAGGDLVMIQSFSDVSIRKALLTYENHKGFYQSKVTSSHAFTQRQVTKHTTVKWTIHCCNCFFFTFQINSVDDLIKKRCPRNKCASHCFMNISN